MGRLPRLRKPHEQRNPFHSNSDLKIPRRAKDRTLPVILPEETRSPPAEEAYIPEHIPLDYFEDPDSELDMTEPVLEYGMLELPKEKEWKRPTNRDTNVMRTKMFRVFGYGKLSEKLKTP